MGALRKLVFLAVVSAVAQAACGPAGTFSLSDEDNDPAAIARALASEKKPTPNAPLNATGKPLAFLLVAGKPKKIVAWDLAARQALWTAEGDVTSRVAVSGPILAHLEGQDTVVARSVADGKTLWKHSLEGAAFLGLAADGDRVYATLEEGGAKRSWALIALRDGKELWRAEAPGTLGAPAARGGLVYMPFLTQWLTILDGESGKVLARVRQTDEAINFVRTTPDGVFYGSRGVFALNDRSFKGTKQGATYGAAKLPEFVRVFYHFDAYKPIQATYSAYDRNRILWRASEKEGRLSFRDGRAVVFTWRFFFGFDVDSGDLVWAYSHPRVDVVAAEHLGSAIAFVTQDGHLGALDPVDGQIQTVGQVAGPILGATFDADGWRPDEKGAGQPAKTYEALESIVWDKDTRYQAQKLFALTALGRLPDTAATAVLLKVLAADGMAPALHEKAAEMLVARKDERALPLLIAALETRHDFVAGTRPRAVAAIARAIGALGKPEGAAALIPHLRAPETPLDAIAPIAEALAACGDPAAVPALTTYLLLYRSDPAHAVESAALSAVIDALLALGGPAERETVAYVASDLRTQEVVAEYARRALAQTRPPAQAEAR